MNLTEVIVRQKDTTQSLRRKVEIATILGTWQATLTNFPYLRKIWKTNTEEERLLGVSMTGIMDNSLTSGGHGPDQLISLLNKLRDHAIEVNKSLAKELGIPQSAAITCVK